MLNEDDMRAIANAAHGFRASTRASSPSTEQRRPDSPRDKATGKIFGLIRVHFPDASAETILSLQRFVATRPAASTIVDHESVPETRFRLSQATEIAEKLIASVPSTPDKDRELKEQWGADYRSYMILGLASRLTQLPNISPDMPDALMSRAARRWAELLPSGANPSRRR